MLAAAQKKFVYSFPCLLTDKGYVIRTKANVPFAIGGSKGPNVHAFGKNQTTHAIVLHRPTDNTISITPLTDQVSMGGARLDEHHETTDPFFAFKVCNEEFALYQANPKPKVTTDDEVMEIKDSQTPRVRGRSIIQREREELAVKSKTVQFQRDDDVDSDETSASSPSQEEAAAVRNGAWCKVEHVIMVNGRQKEPTKIYYATKKSETIGAHDLSQRHLVEFTEMLQCQRVYSLTALTIERGALPHLTNVLINTAKGARIGGLFNDQYHQEDIASGVKVMLRHPTIPAIPSHILTFTRIDAQQAAGGAACTMAYPRDAGRPARRQREAPPCSLAYEEEDNDAGGAAYPRDDGRPARRQREPPCSLAYEEEDNDAGGAACSLAYPSDDERPARRRDTKLDIQGFHRPSRFNGSN
jgi:hypothetical protein